jgi:hypothetical protein
MPGAMGVEYPGAIYDVMDRGDRRELSGQLRRRVGRSWAWAGLR